MQEDFPGDHHDYGAASPESTMGHGVGKPQPGALVLSVDQGQGVIQAPLDQQANSVGLDPGAPSDWNLPKTVKITPVKATRPKRKLVLDEEYR